LCGAWIEQALLLFGDFKEAWGGLIKIINGKMFGETFDL